MRSEMIRLRLIRSNKKYLTNSCGFQASGGTPMVGSSFCTTDCPHYRGVVDLKIVKFVKCNFWNL